MMDPSAVPLHSVDAAASASVIDALCRAVQSVHAASVLVDQMIKSCCNWDTTDFPVVVTTSLTDDKLQTINLMDTFGGTGCVGKLKKAAGVNCHWLPKHLDNCNKVSRLKVYQHFSHSAMKHGGFALRVNGWKENRQTVVFDCIRSNWYEEPRPKKSPPRSVEV